MKHPTEPHNTTSIGTLMNGGTAAYTLSTVLHDDDDDDDDDDD